MVANYYEQFFYIAYIATLSKSRLFLRTYHLIMTVRGQNLQFVDNK